jgi:hypothetical protein
MQWPKKILKIKKKNILVGSVCDGKPPTLTRTKNTKKGLKNLDLVSSFMYVAVKFEKVKFREEEVFFRFSERIRDLEFSLLRPAIKNWSRTPKEGSNPNRTLPTLN